MMLTLSKTQREKGKVTTTISQEMQKRTHPRNPSPVCLDLVTELAAQNTNQIMALLEFIICPKGPYYLDFLVSDHNNWTLFGTII